MRNCARHDNSFDDRNNHPLAGVPHCRSPKPMTADEPCGPPADVVTGWFRQHGQAVRGYLRAMVRREDIADDLAQEVFRRAWQARGSYREQGTPKAYLLKIADRLIIDRARRANPEVQLDENGWTVSEPMDDLGSPTENLEKTESRQELEAALKLLTPPQQRVLLLRFYGDLSFVEIAETMECPLSTALSHCRRALLTLRKILTEQAT